MKIWYCSNCGYEVTNRGRCHACKERLVASELPQLFHVVVLGQGVDVFAVLVAARHAARLHLQPAAVVALTALAVPAAA